MLRMATGEKSVVIELRACLLAYFVLVYVRWGARAQTHKL